MKLEERLTSHFAGTAPKLDGPGGRFDNVVAASHTRSLLAQIMLGAGAFVVGAAIVGLVLWLTAPSPEVESAQDAVESTRVVVSPYVTEQNRLESGSEKVLFTVTSDSPSYWRIASLDVYDGHIWKLARDFHAGPPDLEPGPGAGGDRVVVRQEFAISALNAIWLPVAPEPVEISVRGDVPVTVDRISRTVSVSNDLQDSDGLQYSVVSSVPTPSPGQLRRAIPPDLDAIGRSYLETDTFPFQARALALELTDGLSNDYDRILAIQDHLRSFKYSSAPNPATNDVDPTIRFLDAEEGTAKDFASTFVMMARELGIPSRVAVGFTTGQAVNLGEADSASSSIDFEVRDSDAHAWPEVYFEGIGWIAFEPTPGRQIPMAEGHTGALAD